MQHALSVQRGDNEGGLQAAWRLPCNVALRLLASVLGDAFVGGVCLVALVTRFSPGFVASGALAKAWDPTVHGGAEILQAP